VPLGQNGKLGYHGEERNPGGIDGKKWSFSDYCIRIRVSVIDCSPTDSALVSAVPGTKVAKVLFTIYKPV
jgi:hypothetical protein